MRLQIWTGRRFGRGPFVARPERTLRRLSFGVASGVAALAALMTTPAVAQEVEDGAPPIDPEMAADYFEEARELEAANPWPGTLTGPILFVDPRSRFVVANEPDSIGVLTESADVVGVFTGTLPDEIVIANTATTWSGKTWTMLMWPPPRGYFSRGVLIAHEMFHRLGPRLGFPMASPANAHLDTAEGRTWLRLELRALARALASSGSERRGALEDALAFRIRRQAEFPKGAEEERALELNEGLCEYTGIHVALPPAARAGWAVERIEAREVRMQSGGATRNFAYATGPGYGLLLDAASPEWRRSLDDRSDLATLAARAYEIDVMADSRDRLAPGVTERMDAYDGVRLQRFEAARAEAREREQAAYRKRYIEGPGLTLPVDEEFSYGFDPNAVSTLDGVGQVLATAEVRGGWGSLDVTGGVLLRRTDRGITGIVVPAPGDVDDRPLTGDGWTLNLNEGWEIVAGEREGDFVVVRDR